MTSISLNKPVIGQSNNTEDPKRVACLNLLKDTFNSGIDRSNLSTALARQIGLKTGTTQRRFFKTKAAGSVNTVAAGSTLNFPALNYTVTLANSAFAWIFVMARLRHAGNAASFGITPNLAVGGLGGSNPNGVVFAAVQYTDNVYRYYGDVQGIFLTAATWTASATLYNDKAGETFSVDVDDIYHGGIFCEIS